MSFMLEPTLEYFVADSFMRTTAKDNAAIVKIMEPARESVEIQMENYDAETQSWRDYRNSMWSLYDEYAAAIKRITDADA